MPVRNLAVAAVFGEIADRLEVQDANPFRVRAYRKAARTVQELPEDVGELVAHGQTVEGLPGIGADLAGKVAEIASTGTCTLVEQLRRQMPPAITELLKVPGLGPKRVKALWQELHVQTPEQALRAAHDGRVQGLHGFGETMAKNIEHALRAHLSKERRMKLAVAAEHAESLAAYLRATPQVRQVEVAGSYRRMRDTVGDLDIVVSASDHRAVVSRFTSYPDVEETLAQGATRASVRLRGGLSVDLRVVPAESFGAALAYFTGSKAHNIALRRIAQDRGLKLNEYGLFRGTKRISGETELSVYAALGLPWIPPELREDRGEIEAAREGRLPKLIELANLRGDLHVHTTATDGRDTLETMVAAAKTRGLEYMAITDHSRRQTMAHGLDPARLAKQGGAIDRLNATMHGFRVLKGIEVDILPAGQLDLPDDTLERLDVVIAAVHSKFDLDRASQTERILRALDNPLVTLLAHPTGRLLSEREPYDVDMLQIIRKARARRVHLEVNAHPERLDLVDTHCRMARDEGVLVVINSDAHAARELDNLRFGVGQARRGWITASDVLNARPLSQVLALLRPASKRRATRTAVMV